MITDYCVKEFDNLGMLAMWVKQMLAEGWQPLGQAMPYSRSYTHPEGNWLTADDYYVQTMVKVQK